MTTELQELDWSNHLRERGLRPSFKYWTALETQEVLFPLWMPGSGRLVGYQKYNWREAKTRSNAGKYFTWIIKEYKPLGIWGWEYANISEPIFIVEGIWDAISIINCGYSALAILTATPALELTCWLKMNLCGRRTIAILDCDENKAGDGLVELAKESYYSPKAFNIKDMNEMYINHPVDCQNFLNQIIDKT